MLSIPMDTQTAYTACAVVIFSLVAFTFLFPCNFLIPLDRRTVAVVGALACYLTRTYLFPSEPINLLEAIDFDVLILLSSIMIINHIVIHLKETKKLIKYFQNLIKSNPIRGFWMVSLVAFLASPFLTNDGVCLLLVEPILFAFQDAQEDQADNNEEETAPSLLNRDDIIYFLLALACSTNIGSALTYTGNPQNMIVASDSIGGMPSYKFLIYMILPGTLTWLITIKWIEYCWGCSKVQRSELTADEMKRFSSTDEEKNDSTKGILSPKIKIKLPMMEQEQKIEFNCLSSKSNGSPTKAATSALSPRRKRAREREKLVKKVVKVVSSPLPYCILGILLLMVILIFVNVMPIAGLICVIAIVMVLFIVMGNRWKDSLVWEEDSHHTHRSNGNNRSRSHTRNNSMTQVLDSAVFSNSGGLHSQVIHTPLALQDTTPPSNHLDADELGPLTHEDKIDNLNEFFEDLFHSIDYSLLLIFLGTFIVVENMASTGIPRIIFKSLVGPVPFKTIYSIFGISCFVLIASQLLGNVAVVQLAKPNVHELNEEDKRFAWALISFISTIGGNLTIAGSAANIIVAEKANRLDAMINFNFFRHHKVCFWITLACCLIGGTILALIVMVDNSLGSKW